MADNNDDDDSHLKALTRSSGHGEARRTADELPVWLSVGASWLTLSNRWFAAPTAPAAICPRASNDDNSSEPEGYDSVMAKVQYESKDDAGHKF